jgi:tetraacyldisaccharide 4'-kinase
VSLLNALYGAGIGWRNRGYDRGTLAIHHLQKPVVSVGSLSAGGAGKTPFVIMLGGLLKQRGIAFDVLSRGYGRESKGTKSVDSSGSPREFGDEPLLITRKLGVPVIVGEDRFAAGKLAEEKFASQLHLLDDGFQHRRVARDFDIVLVTQRDLQDSLLPSGRLREPLSSLQRASAIVLMDEVRHESLPICEGQDVWRVKRGVVVPEVNEPCFAFCGIARPEAFYMALAEAGVRVVGTRAFRDHHAYDWRDVEALYKQGQQAGATEFVTTEKDAVNFAEFAERLRPLHITSVRMEFEPDNNAPIDRICEVIGRHDEVRVRE